MSDKDIDHDGLCRLYGTSLDAMRWQSFYGVRFGQFVEGTPEADILVVRKSYTQRELRIVEVKVSTSDLRQDVIAGKWRKYLPYCDRMYFLLGPKVDPSILDGQDCGIIRYNGSGFTTKRVAPWSRERRPLTEEELLAIIFSHFDSSSRLKRMEYRLESMRGKELERLTYQFSRQLNDRAKAVIEREERCIRVEENARREALRSIRTALNLKDSWWSSDDARKVVSERLEEGLRELFHTNLKAVVELVMSAEEPDAEESPC
jgi:hypothetical protein